ncbi:sporulation integral membrane protein YlbJ [Clostridium sp. Cult3]|uniref:sporulation integral membrane protein YlbJ n=1 Tax=Clostridium sp. Cult3 TaxID=2079004 RepID=UPI001F000B5F|nr:sporulation integral membrane protein YlbJ [Clostridium sp. Cult3]MCF6461037.1 sporulation integral membrane protein YlbJ [Clostridium sp. Cult3]
MKNSLINIVFIIILICILIGIVINPKLALDSAHDGLLTWFNIVIPSLLPFFIISELLIGVGFVNFVGQLLEPLMKPIFNISGVGAFPFSMSIISGYPTGVRIVSSLRSSNAISKTEAERMVCFSSTSGPLFMIGAVSIGMFNDPSIAPLILYPHYLGALTLGLLLRFYKSRNKKVLQCGRTRNNRPIALINFKPKHPIGKIISDSVKVSINTITLIGGFMILYAVLVELLFASNIFNLLVDIIQRLLPFKTDIEVLKAFIAGVLELTTGCKKISAINIALIYKIVMVNFLIGWSGFSVHSQALSFISNTDINGKLYLFAKFLHGCLSSIYTYTLYTLKYKNLISPSFYPYPYPIDPIYALEWPYLLINSFKLAILMTIYLLISSLIMLLIECFTSSE